VDGFWSELLRQGYSPLSAGNLLRVAAHFSGWLEGKKIRLSRLTAGRVAAYFEDRRKQGYTQFLTCRALEPLLGYLRSIDVVPHPCSRRIADTPVNRLVKEYERYLADVRGLVSSTIRGYADFTKRFVEERGRLDWRSLTAADVTDYVVRHSREMTVGYLKSHVCSLRSLLRFLHVRGSLKQDLSSGVPAVAGWRLASVPKALESDQVTRLLASFDSDSPVGRRDSAMVRLMVRLGLRAGEVASLELDDIDWRAGEIAVRGKGPQEGRLPLPHDVGCALVAYLRKGRPHKECQHVFLRSRPPFRGLSAGGVIQVASCALRRLGVGAGAAHLLRHTAATEMLRRGASLPEIGQVLRHRHMDTTAIYAKVDHAALRQLAQPWPGGAA
jgi:site-specific recombinase XerD